MYDMYDYFFGRKDTTSENSTAPDQAASTVAPSAEPVTEASDSSSPTEAHGSRAKLTSEALNANSLVHPESSVSTYLDRFTKDVSRKKTESTTLTSIQQFEQSDVLDPPAGSDALNETKSFDAAVEAPDPSPPPQNHRDRHARRTDFEKFVKLHNDLLKVRITTDEKRRKTRIQRRIVREFAACATTRQHRAVTAEPDSQLGRLQQIEDAEQRLEVLEDQLDEAETEVIQLEASVQRMLPMFEGSEADMTFEILEENHVYIRADSSESEILARRESPVEVEISPERVRVFRQLDQIDNLEEELLELQDDRSRLRAMEGDHETLTQEQRDLLDTYDERKADLKQQLRSARKHLEQLQSAAYEQSLVDMEAESLSNLRSTGTMTSETELGPFP